MRQGGGRGQFFQCKAFNVVRLLVCEGVLRLGVNNKAIASLESADSRRWGLCGLYVCWCVLLFIFPNAPQRF